MGSTADPLSMLPGELRELLLDLDEAPFRGDQLFRWIHKEGVLEYGAMTDMSKGLRAKLASCLPLQAPLLPITHEVSRDQSVKLVSQTPQGNPVESVLIPASGEDRRLYTLCVSTQSGCAVGCAFCETSTMGFLENLSPVQIAYQVTLALDTLAQYKNEAFSQRPREQWITNIVYMGMGEPFLNLESVIRSLYLLTHPKGLNFSQRRITLSTSGIVPGFRRLAQEEGLRVNLALSLNSPFQKVREALMPITKTYGVDSLVRALEAYPLPKRQRITIEYILFKGINDTLKDARALVRLLSKVRVKLNLIPYNPGSAAKTTPLGVLHASDPKTVETFAAFLRKRGLAVTVRHSYGQDINAACGQLARHVRGNKEKEPGRMGRGEGPLHSPTCTVIQNGNQGGSE